MNNITNQIRLQWDFWAAQGSTECSKYLEPVPDPVTWGSNFAMARKCYLTLFLSDIYLIDGYLIYQMNGYLIFRMNKYSIFQSMTGRYGHPSYIHLKALRCTIHMHLIISYRYKCMPLLDNFIFLHSNILSLIRNDIHPN